MNLFSRTKHPRFVAYTERLLERSYVFVFLLVLQSYINIYFNGFMTDPKVIEPLYRLTFLPFFWSFVILALLSLIKSPKTFKRIKWIIYLVASLFFLGEGFLLDTYSTFFSPSIALAILATNSNETKEFWSSTIYWSTYYPTFLALGGAAVLSLATRMLCYFILHLSTKIKDFLLPILPMGMLSVFLVGIGYFYPRMFYVFYTKPDAIAFATLTPPERLFWAFEETFSHLQEQDEYISKLEGKDSLEGYISQDESFPKHHFVFILGESLRPDFMHCYGYPLENTPKLDSLTLKGDLQLFSDAVSSNYFTIGSITNLMSLKTVEDSATWYEKPCLPVFMKSANYRTFWLSKQEKYSSYIQPVSAIATQADSTFHITRGGQDDAVLPHIKSYIKETPIKDQNSFELIHLMGSHVDYGSRYKASFEKFKAQDILQKGFASDQDKATTIAQYLNSIYFNDYVVSQIIEAYKDEPAIIIYLSDHGQAIYDDPNNPNLAGHSLSLGGVSIPFMIYVSPKMQELEPSLLPRIKKVKDRPFMSDILPYSIMGLLKIKSDYYKADFDIFSEGYNLNRKRESRWDKRIIDIKHNSVKPELMPYH